MSAGAETLEEALVDLVTQRATGVMEVVDDRKRWQFFFEDGELVATRSNLRSEQDETIYRDLGDLSAPQLAQAGAGRRVANACRASRATWQFTPVSQPSKRAPADIRAALYEGVREAREDATLRERLAPLLGGFPISLEPEIATLTGTPVDAYLSTLDGSRPGQDVVDFAPSEPRATLAALWLGWQLGLIGMEDEPAAGVAVEASTPVPTAAPTPAPLPPAEVAAQPSAASAHEATLPGRGPRTPAPVETASSRLRPLEERIRAAQNHFEVLGVAWSDPPDALRGAYMKLARELHPDRFAGGTAEERELATELFDKVRAAWEVIGDDDERKVYTDRVIHGKKSEDELAMEQVQNYLAAEADFKRGMAAFNAGRTVQALTHFQSAVAKAPEELEFQAYCGYATFWVNQKKDPETAALGFRMLEAAVRRNAEQERKRDTLHVLLSRAWRERGETARARAAARDALRINPNNADAVRLLRRIQEEEQGSAQQAGGVMGRLTGFFEGIFKKKEPGKDA